MEYAMLEAVKHGVSPSANRNLRTDNIQVSHVAREGLSFSYAVRWNHCQEATIFNLCLETVASRKICG
jgi:hypothetical protein